MPVVTKVERTVYVKHHVLIVIKHLVSNFNKTPCELHTTRQIIFLVKLLSSLIVSMPNSIYCLRALMFELNEINVFHNLSVVIAKYSAMEHICLHGNISTEKLPLNKNQRGQD
jgi:hypothetical protein